MTSKLPDSHLLVCCFTLGSHFSITALLEELYLCEVTVRSPCAGFKITPRNVEGRGRRFRHSRIEQNTFQQVTFETGRLRAPICTNR